MQNDGYTGDWLNVREPSLLARMEQNGRTDVPGLVHAGRGVTKADGLGNRCTGSYWCEKVSCT